MKALELLLCRNSSARLCAPAPGGDALQSIFRAALRAPDHARLRPWRFLVIEGAGRERLGELFERVSLDENPLLTEAARQKIRAKPMRAPMIIVAAVRLQAHPKVPEIEQYLSAGSAVHAMLLAASAQGFAGIWRTGGFAANREVHRGLGLQAGEKIVGFLYLGTREGQSKPLPLYEPGDYFQSWP